MKAVVDSSILIDHFRGGIKWQEFLDQTPDDIELFLPTIVLFELFSGKSSRKNDVVKKILNLLKLFTQVELSGAIAIRAGELYRDSKTQIDAADYIIAASALEINAALITLNRKHFAQIANLSLYQI